MTDQVDEKAARDERTAGRLGWIGLALVAIGTLLQITSSWITWT